MKVLLSAYSCEPGKGSEQAVGWSIVRQIARFHDVWVLTHQEGKRRIEAAIATENLRNVHFTYLDVPQPLALYLKKGRRGVQLHYYVWQITAYFAGRRLHRKIDFDLIHHVTLVRYWMPNFLALLPVPFLWGPVGGGECAPRAFWWSLSLRGKLMELARDLARKIGEYDPFVRRTARKAAFGLATTEQSAKRMRTLACKEVSVLPAVGLDQEEISSLATIPVRHSSPFRLISVGRLVHWKGFHLSVRAFAEFHRQFPDSEYWLVGYPHPNERRRLEKLAQRLGVADNVTFWGDISRALVLEKLADCDVLIHPSLHDSGGYVCLEAMAAGRPVICLDLGGPGLLVTENTGIKIKARTPTEAVRDLTKAILRLAEDPESRVRMGEASRQRVKEQFDWVRRGNLINDIYESAARGVAPHRAASSEPDGPGRSKLDEFAAPD